MKKTWKSHSSFATASPYALSLFLAFLAFSSSLSLLLFISVTLCSSISLVFVLSFFLFSQASHSVFLSVLHCLFPVDKRCFV